jgi:polyisoprenoid-binding protein YceI
MRLSLNSRFSLVALAVVGFGRAGLAQPAGDAPAPVQPVPAAQGGEAEAAPAGPRTFTLDAKKSSFVVQVFKAGAASALAHDHVVNATSLTGTVVLDAASLATAAVDVTVQTMGLVNDEPALRKRYGLEGEVAEKDRAAILDNMRNEDQLDTKKFPTIRFVSTSVVPGTGTALTLKGRLTIKGVTKDISLPCDVVIKNKTVDGKGSVRLKTSDFGIEPYSAFLGAVRNQDEIILHVRFVASTP